MSRAELLLGDAEAALTWARRAVELLGDVPRIESVTAQLGVAAALYGAGRVADARQQLGRAEETLRTLAPSRASAMGWRRVGDLYRDLGDEHAALMALDMALAASGLPARPTSPRMQSRAQPASAAGREGG
jgi:tetratricopeptide (TPR) repeat protein